MLGCVCGDLAGACTDLTKFIRMKERSLSDSSTSPDALLIIFPSPLLNLQPSSRIAFPPASLLLVPFLPLALPFLSSCPFVGKCFFHIRTLPLLPFPLLWLTLSGGICAKASTPPKALPPSLERYLLLLTFPGTKSTPKCISTCIRPHTRGRHLFLPDIRPSFPLYPSRSFPGCFSPHAFPPSISLLLSLSFFLSLLSTRAISLSSHSLSLAHTLALPLAFTYPCKSPHRMDSSPVP